jgi:hypothetical protein
VIRLDGQKIEPPPFVRRGPGVWFLTFVPRRGWGGATLSFAATFDGEEIVEPKTVPVATDIWTAQYPARAKGGCSCDTARARGTSGLWMSVVPIALAAARRARRVIRPRA